MNGFRGRESSPRERSNLRGTGKGPNMTTPLEGGLEALDDWFCLSVASLSIAREEEGFVHVSKIAPISSVITEGHPRKPSFPSRQQEPRCQPRPSLGCGCGSICPVQYLTARSWLWRQRLCAIRPPRNPTAAADRQLMDRYRNHNARTTDKLPKQTRL